MENGYYLSSYIVVDKLQHLYSMDAYSARHDGSIALWKKEGDNVLLIEYWELERITGLKHHPYAFYDIEQAKVFINLLLKPYHLTLENDIIECWGTPGIGEKDIPFPNIPDSLPLHSIAHLYSGLLTDTEIFHKEKILAMAVDGYADSILDDGTIKEHQYAGCISKDGRVSELFPVYSPGLLWIAAKEYLKLEEGSLMALATASTSELLDYEPQMIYLDSHFDSVTAEKYVSDLIEYVNTLKEEDAGIRYNGMDTRFSIQDNKISMIMKVISKVSVAIMCKNIDSIIERYHIKTEEYYLSLTGGYALNCPTNSYLMKKYHFKGYVAPPCVNDSGMSLGLGLYMFYQRMGDFNFQLKHPYYGRHDQRLTECLESKKWKPYIKQVSKLKPETIVDDILQGPIVWFNDAAEIGPRALGTRSILGNPRSNTTKDCLNEIKQRQWWRPVAPIILEEHVSEWFEDAYASPFMLHTFYCKASKAALVPAILHLDQSARVQTLNEKSNALLYQVVTAFYRRTGIPILCNTSLNDRGEPIIDQIPECLNFALRKKIPVVYINGVRVELNLNLHFEDKVPEARVKFFIYKSEEERQQLLKEENPYGLTKEELFFMCSFKSHFDSYSTKDESDVHKFKKFMKRYQKLHQ